MVTGFYKLATEMLDAPLDFEPQPRLYVDGEVEWLSRGGKKLLMIPADYKGRLLNLGEKTHVQTNFRGQVVLLDFE